MKNSPFNITNWCLWLVGNLLCASLVLADNYPSKPISFVVPVPPGGLVDASARIVGDALSTILPQPIIIENKPGASGNIAYQQVARSNKDGYAVLVSYSGYHVSNPILMDKLPWDTKQLTPIGLVTVATNVIAVHPSLPVNNLKEFIAYAKANPTKLNYASQGNGSVSHIGTEVFKQKFGIEVVHVPYKGSGAAIADVLAGQVQLFITTPPSVMGHVQTGKLKALAVTSKKRHPMMPDVPTVAEAGVSNFELESWVALYVASDTPNAVITTLSSAVEKALSLAETKKRADLAGIELRYLTPTRMTAMLNKEIVETAIAIKAAKITLD
ncbi:MAG: tripartite tricarboxylate transporter substrate binding protein [Burkholderiales bacterium]|nr:tripartite tricarboxylate transporter substrate binding protein [Burkholderiales bacterium]